MNVSSPLAVMKPTVSAMRDYGKMFLGLILAGIILIVLSLWLVGVHVRTNTSEQSRPALSRTLSKV